MRTQIAYDEPDAMGRRVPIRILNADGTPATGEAGNAARMWTADTATEGAIGNLTAAYSTFGLYYVELTQAQSRHLPGTDGLMYYKGASSIAGHTQLTFTQSRYKWRGTIAAATTTTVDLPVSLTTIRPGDVLWLVYGTGAPQAAVVKSHDPTGGAGAKSRITIDATFVTTPDNTTVAAVEAGPLPATFIDSRLVAIDTTAGDDATKSLGKMARSGTPFKVTGTSSASVIQTDLTGYDANALAGGGYMKFYTGALAEQGRSIIENDGSGLITVESFTRAPAVDDEGVVL